MEQAGSGMGYYAGSRYQKGNGFFGRFISGSMLPLIKKVLPFLGKSALNTGIDVLNDWSQGEKLKDSLSKRVKDTAEKINETAKAKVKEITGSGKRKRWTQDVPAKKQKRVDSKKKRRKTKKTRKALDFL